MLRKYELKGNTMEQDAAQCIIITDILKVG